MRRKLTRNGNILTITVVAALTFGAGGAVANTKGEHCTSPFGNDLNELYGVSATIVAPFCPQLRAGEHWTTPMAWVANTSFEGVPADFVPAGSTPLDDFRAKLVSVRYVIDAGTKQERTYVFLNGAELWTGIAFGFPAANTVTLGTLHPLSRGEHRIDRYWRFSAMTCDGFGTVVGENCLSAGDFNYGPATFEVLPASQQD